MTINLKAPELRELKPRIMVCGVGGAGGNAVNNMIESGLMGVDFIVANTDAQALTKSKAERIIQMGLQVTEGLGAGSRPEVGHASAEEAMEEVRDHLSGAHMVFVTAGMGGGTGTGAAPVIARVARDMGILTVGVVTKPFQFEGQRRMRIAEAGITELQKSVDTLIVIPNQNLFRIANERTTFADAFSMADQVLYSGVACITDLMVKEGLINLDFADVRAIMREMGKAMMGTGEASGDKRALHAAEAAIANPLLDEVSMRGARGLLISITGGSDLTLYEVDEAASRIRQEVDEDANIILGATFDSSLDGIVRVSVVATGIDTIGQIRENPDDVRISEMAQRLRQQASLRQAEMAPASSAPVIETAPVMEVQAQSVAQELEQPVLEAQAGAEAEVLSLTPLAAAPQAAHTQAAQIAAHEAMWASLEALTPVAHEAPASPVVDHNLRAPTPSLSVPAPEQVQIRTQRLPQIEDLPRPVQNQIRAQRGEPAVDQAGDKRRSLLERLATLGLGRHEEPAGPAAQRQRRPASAPQPAPQAPAAQRPGLQPTPTSEFAKRAVAPQRAALDVNGRVVTPQRMSEDDQLEIPAFLRRANNG